jgi:hypothetical protein
MSINDRGKKKWFVAFFMPEHVRILKGLQSDYYKQQKPLLDSYQIEEMENKMHESLAFHSPVKITVWEDGFFHEFKGWIHLLDGMSKVIYLVINQEEGNFERIHFDDIISIEYI